MVERLTPDMLPEVVGRVWDLRAVGATREEIGAAVGWSRAAVQREITERRGIRPQWRKGVPVRSLSFLERERIMVLRASGVGVRQIGRELGRAASTISRELKRGASAHGEYRMSMGQHVAFLRSRRPKAAKLQTNQRLRDHVQAALKAKLSPEQVSGRLLIDFPDDSEMRVSHETIYQSVYLLARGGLKRDLEITVRTGRTVRKPDRRAGVRRPTIKDMVMIADRPAEVADRTVPGHWEGDLIVGSSNRSAIGTVVERTTGFLMLIHMPADKPRVDAIRDGLIEQLRDLPDYLRRSLTWDQGVEMIHHKQVSVAADIDIYFCDPHTPWQRPTNENTNGLLRQYFPKGTDLSGYSPLDLASVAWEMNDRPRKRLGFMKPAEMIEQLLLR